VSQRPLHPRVGGGYGQGGRACRNAQQPAAADQAQPGWRRRPGGDRYRRRQRRRCAPVRAVRHHTGDQAGPSGVLHGAPSGCVSASSACRGGARLRRPGSSLLPGLVLVATPSGSVAVPSGSVTQTVTQTCTCSCTRVSRRCAGCSSGASRLRRACIWHRGCPQSWVFATALLARHTGWLVARALDSMCCAGCRDAGSPHIPRPNAPCCSHTRCAWYRQSCRGTPDQRASRRPGRCCAGQLVPASSKRCATPGPCGSGLCFGSSSAVRACAEAPQPALAAGGEHCCCASTNRSRPTAAP